jgi:pyridoxal phosphate enzyme (YggS family)
MTYDLNDLRNRFQKLYEEIAQTCEKVGRNKDTIKVVVVTKTHPKEVLQALIDIGHSDIGENRVQEIVQKVPDLRGNKTIHLVGHLQTNKVIKVVPLVDWIQSIDNERLAEKIEQQCEKIGKEMNVLVQVNTSKEETKFGCRPEEAPMLCEKVSKYRFLRLRGLMTIGLWGGGERETRHCFSTLRSISEQTKNNTDLPFELSMGMSGDFKIALEEGATIIRVGTYILGR